MISSTSNPKIKDIVRLMKSGKLRRERDCFLVEGPRMYFELDPERIMACFVTDKFRKKYEDRMQFRDYELIDDRVCRHISDTKTPQGVVALVRRQEAALDDILDREPAPCLFLLESLQDPGNLGTILRTGEAAGITALVVNRETVDPYNMKVIRASMGAILRLPLVIEDDFKGLCLRLKDRGIPLYAAHLEGANFYSCDYRGSCAFLIGNEGQGLSEGLTRMADRKIRIPMKGEAESLNAAVASALIMYEVLRQREGLLIPQ